MKIVADAQAARAATYAENFKWRPAYALQLTTWLQPIAHELAAKVWWGSILEVDASADLIAHALRMTMKAKTAKLFDFREVTEQFFERVLADHGARHAKSYSAMKRAAGEAFRLGATRQQAAHAVVEVARQQECPPPPYLIADAVEFAEKDIFFENLRGQPRQTRRKSKARAR